MDSEGPFPFSTFEHSLVIFFRPEFLIPDDIWPRAFGGVFC